MRSKKAKCEIFAIFNRFDSVFVLLIFFLRLMSHFSIVNPSKSPNPILKYGKGRVQKNPSKYGLFPKGGGGGGGVDPKVHIFRILFFLKGSQNSEKNEFIWYKVD